MLYLSNMNKETNNLNTNLDPQDELRDMIQIQPEELTPEGWELDEVWGPICGALRPIKK